MKTLESVCIDMCSSLECIFEIVELTVWGFRVFGTCKLLVLEILILRNFETKTRGDQESKKQVLDFCHLGILAT